MNVCPNSDPNFDKILSNFIDINNVNYADVRKNLFYFVCIVVRTLLYSYVYVNRNEKWIPYVFSVFAFVSMFNLYGNLNNGNQWWSKKYQFIIALLIFICCIIIITGLCEINTKIIPTLLFASLFGGILQSFFIDFC